MYGRYDMYGDMAGSSNKLRGTGLILGRLFAPLRPRLPMYLSIVMLCAVVAFAM